MCSERLIDIHEVFTDDGFRLRIMRLPHASEVRRHGHAFHELVVVQDGQGSHRVGEELFTIGRGDVFVLLGGSTHGYSDTDRLSIINILYDPVHLGFPLSDLGALPGYHALFTVEPYIRGQGTYHNRLRLSPEELAVVSSFISDIEEELTGRTPGYRFLAVSHFMRLIGYLSRSYSRLPAERKRPAGEISEVLGFIERRYSQRIGLADLAHAATMSQTSLLRIFKQITGFSPIEYLIRLRLSRAIDFLRDTNLRVSEIAYRVGFEDSNYFARRFKAAHGVSPREYRDRERKRL